MCNLGATAHSAAVHTFSFHSEQHRPTGNGAKFPLRNASFFNGSVRPPIPLFPVVLSHSGSRMVAATNTALLILPHLDLNESQHGYSYRNWVVLKGLVKSGYYSPLLPLCYHSIWGLSESPKGDSK